MIQGIFFVFGTFVLFGLSFLYKREVEYKNKVIGLMILWALMNVFIHTFNFSLSNGVTATFLNYCLLSEGFIYILCGLLLFHLVVSYKKNFNIVYPILSVNILNLIFSVTQRMGLHWIWTNNHSISGVMGQCSQFSLFSALSIPILWSFNKKLILIPIICLYLYHSFSSLAALMITLVIYYAINRNLKKLYMVLIGVLAFSIFYYHNIAAKLSERIPIWSVDLKEVFIRPIFGFGFDNSLRFNKILSLKEGWVFRHNDFLNITRDLGFPFLIMILVGLFLIFKKAKMDYLFCSILIILIVCLVETNFYFPRVAGISLVLLALKERQNLDG